MTSACSTEDVGPTYRADECVYNASAWEQIPDTDVPADIVAAFRELATDTTLDATWFDGATGIADVRVTRTSAPIEALHATHPMGHRIEGCARRFRAWFDWSASLAPRAFQASGTTVAVQDEALPVHPSLTIGNLPWEPWPDDAPTHIDTVAIRAPYVDVSVSRTDAAMAAYTQQSVDGAGDTAPPADVGIEIMTTR